ncbi:hypothetical protein INS49_003010 [Diaporthe citri]|uniref:uncharacterized protein n=1 Tax=Diaporthe citri TaxID=83186 RepID=UPI001C81F577|nr:uncharacterized protein INS49_003010 [Diaporthe citri]KAG6368796.1 hypothetical protein INS49_003010 [Diaporthe citri]
MSHIFRLILAQGSQIYTIVLSPICLSSSLAPAVPFLLLLYASYSFPAVIQSPASTMRFLNTENFKIHHSTGPPPSYSVFCHAHGCDDIGFEDFSNPEMLPHKAGFHRLWQACNRARNHGSKWLWSDAVCIDRGSSAALTEAFNSLARIYQECTFSLIYLEDLPPGDCIDAGLEKRLANCAWLRNVWVLPQLIFPKHSYIYDKDWNEIGTKTSLARQLSLATSIEQSVLINPAALGEYSVAKRISWASQLDASRPEDRSFALLGILGKKFYETPTIIPCSLGAQKYPKNTEVFSHILQQSFGISTKRRTDHSASGARCNPFQPVSSSMRISNKSVTILFCLWKMLRDSYTPYDCRSLDKAS